MAQHYVYSLFGRRIMAQEDERTERIRRRAYHLWEAAGKPEGQEDYFWNIAAGDIDVEDAEAGETP
jgi:hypothetical protein